MPAIRHVNRLRRLYEQLLAHHGPQGWWPLIQCPGTLVDDDGVHRGYHRGDYSFPHSKQQAFEICCGAILTQNTAWANVRQALASLAGLEGLDPRTLSRLPPATLRQAIRPSGYFNMKAQKLLVFADFFRSLRGRVPRRDELLAVWGIGPETADSIRLYAYAQPEMVVDAYTRRILEHAGLMHASASYEEIKRACADALPAEFAVYQEFHALMVAHGKLFYSRQPYGSPPAPE